MDGGHVHVVGLGLEHRAAARRFGPEEGVTAQHLFRLQPADRGHELRIIGGGSLYRGFLSGMSCDQGAAGRQQRMIGEARRRIAVEAARGHRDGANLGTAIGLGVQRRRAPRRVIGGHVLALEDDHFRMGREVIGDGDAGNAGADNGKIEILHGRHIARSMPRLQ